MPHCKTEPETCGEGRPQIKVPFIATWAWKGKKMIKSPGILVPDRPSKYIQRIFLELVPSICLENPMLLQKTWDFKAYYRMVIRNQDKNNYKVGPY